MTQVAFVWNECKIPLCESSMVLLTGWAVIAKNDRDMTPESSNRPIRLEYPREPCNILNEQYLDLWHYKGLATDNHIYMLLPVQCFVLICCIISVPVFVDYHIWKGMEMINTVNHWITYFHRQQKKNNCQCIDFWHNINLIGKLYRLQIILPGKHKNYINSIITYFQLCFQI